MPKKIKKTKSPETKPDSNILPFPLLRREAMEAIASDVFGESNSHDVDKAQDLIYDAWDAQTSQQRIALARKALSISPDCADAYVLLAQETAASLAEETEYYRQAVMAGERALGKDAFVEDVGHFWGMLETRPYMRARAGLAECLWDAGKCDDAVAHYWDMLRLNPNDNQGMRYNLMPRLIELGLDNEAEKLYGHYSDEGSAFWAYARVLLDFRKEGDSPAAGRSLKEALNVNKHVPLYLIGRKRMPRSMPDHYGFGDTNEAVICADDCKTAWSKTNGALKWLTDKLKQS